MKRAKAFFRNLFLSVLTVSITVGLFWADWYLRNEPVRKAIRLLNREGTPIEIGSAVEAARQGRVFTLEKLETAGIDLGARDGKGVTPLLAAMRAENAVSVDFLLERKPVRKHLDTEAEDDGFNAVELALSKRDFSMANRLIDLGANPDVSLTEGVPLLVESCRKRDWRTFDFLLDRGVSPDAADAGGLTSLESAIGQQDGERIHQLIEAGADVEVAGQSGDSLLVEAARRSEHDLVETLLAAGADPDRVGDSGATALITALQNGDALLAGAFLEQGADPNQPGAGGTSPLSLATSLQDVDLMQALIDSGADAKEDGLLVRAYRNRDLPALELLLQSGADPETKNDSGLRVLDLAIASDSLDTARALLGYGADAGKQLWPALRTGNEPMMELVLLYGGNVNEIDSEEGLPLEYSLRNGWLRTSTLLLEKGADANLKRKNEETWLAAAIRENETALARVLLDNGAKVAEVTDKDGHTLLGWAIANKNRELVDRLLEAGADVRAREHAPATTEFRDRFERSKTFRWHLQADSRITPLMMGAAQGDIDIVNSLMAAGAKSGDCSRRYLWPINIAAWHMDVPMMQVILGRDPDPDKQPRKIVIDLSKQRAYLYKDGKQVYSTRVSTGKSGYRTPTGSYVISDKHRHHNSTLYGSSMPYFMRLSCAAFGLHEGYVPSYPASHGCIRVPYSGAKHLFSTCEIGDRVEITY